MVDDAVARQELIAQMRDLLKAVRLFKNDMPTGHTAVPAGTLGVLATISHIAAQPDHGCHLKDLAALSALDPSTVSRSVAALVRAGLVERTADPADGRASVLDLTALGRQTLAEVNGWADRSLADALREWHPEDVAVLAALLRRFTTDLLTRYHHNPLEVAR